MWGTNPNSNHVPMALHIPQEMSHPARPYPYLACSVDSPLSLAIPGEATQVLVSTAMHPTGASMRASLVLCCSRRLINLYRVFARQLTYSLCTNYAEPSISHHQSQNLLPSTLSRGQLAAPCRGPVPRQGLVPVHGSTAAPQASMFREAQTALRGDETFGLSLG